MSSPQSFDKNGKRKEANRGVFLLQLRQCDNIKQQHDKGKGVRRAL